MSAQKIEYPPKLSHCNTCRGKRTMWTQGLLGEPRRLIKCGECKGFGYLTTQANAIAEVVQAYATKTPDHSTNNVPQTDRKPVHEVQKVEISPPKRRGRPPRAR